MVKKLEHCHWRSPRIIKLGVSLLLVALAFMLVYNRSSAVLTAPYLENTISVGNTDQIPSKESNGSEEKCNLFIGDWVYQAEPLYTNSSCSFIEDHQNCMKNGRPDSDYLYWRWKPRDCELGRLDPARFLELMRNKSWAFIGDSISRNHVHSILCGLSMVEMPIEVYHDETYKSRRWHFPLHNFTLSAVWSPFLTYAATFEDNNGVSTSDIQLHLDILDKNWTEQYRSHDYVMLSVGKWFTKTAIYYENNTVLGCYNCTNSDLTKLRFNFAYRRAMRTVFDYIIA